jgi:hypothetical protein
MGHAIGPTHLGDQIVAEDVPEATDSDHRAHPASAQQQAAKQQVLILPT